MVVRREVVGEGVPDKVVAWVAGHIAQERAAPNVRVALSALPDGVAKDARC